MRRGQKGPARFAWFFRVRPHPLCHNLNHQPSKQRTFPMNGYIQGSTSLARYQQHCLRAGLPCLVERQGARDSAECEPIDGGSARGAAACAGGEEKGGVR